MIKAALGTYSLEFYRVLGLNTAIPYRASVVSDTFAAKLVKAPSLLTFVRNSKLRTQLREHYKAAEKRLDDVTNLSLCFHNNLWLTFITLLSRHMYKATFCGQIDTKLRV